MPTDDQLTRDLGDAFRAATAHLTYDGPVPSPRRTSLIVAPAVAVGVAGVASAIALGGHGSQPHRGAASNRPLVIASQPTRSTPSLAAPARNKLVMTRLSLAGYVMTYPRTAGGAHLFATFIAKVPTAATPVTTPGPAKGYVGIDPSSGKETAYVATASGKVLAISSPDATRHQLVALLQSVEPQAVPLVGHS